MLKSIEPLHVGCLVDPYGACPGTGAAYCTKVVLPLTVRSLW